MSGNRWSYLFLALVLGIGMLPGVHASEAESGVARIADSSTGDGLEEPKFSLFPRWGGRTTGGGFFFVAEIDGEAMATNNLDESIRASLHLRREMHFKKVERSVSAGKHRVKLVGRYSHAAPIDNLFRSNAGYRVDGEMEVTLRPNVLYRVRGILEEFRQEVWLEEAESGELVGEKLVNATVEQARNQAMENASFACCNLRFQEDWISDLNETGLPYIPAGTPIAIREYGRNRIHVVVDGRPMAIGHDYGRKQGTKEQLVARLLVKDDPRQKIATYPPAIQSAVRSGKVLPGMNKEQVLIALSYPRPDMNASLDEPVWKYSTEDGYDYQVTWGEDGLLSSVLSEEPDIPARILQTNN